MFPRNIRIFSRYVTRSSQVRNFIRAQNEVETKINAPKGKVVALLKPIAFTATANTKRDIAWYGAAIAITFLALSYAAVPLYRVYCQVTGKGGKAVAESEEKVKQLKRNDERLLTVTFNADTASQMAWRFEPVQSQVKLRPGETTLAFYRAKNPLDEPVIGVATYAVLPYEAGLYLNKIQCFCFEEQMLSPHEDVFMPVFFYIDPKYVEDPRLEGVDELILSYTFFQSKDGGLFMPSLPQNKSQAPVASPGPSQNPNPNTLGIISSSLKSKG